MEVIVCKRTERIKWTNRTKQTCPPMVTSNDLNLNICNESLQQGSIFRSENDTYLFPPPFWKWYFSPSRDSYFFKTPIVAFLPLFLPILQLFYPFTFPFLIFFPFLPFSFSFLPYSFTFSPFFPSPFHIFFPQMTSADILPPPKGGGIFQYIDTCITVKTGQQDSRVNNY